LRHFGSQPQAECSNLKKDLLKMEQPGTGRVLLSDFYGNTKLQVHESLAYLRNLGVVEEQDGAPRLIIPNYISSPSRCMPFSEYYSVCCPNECDALMVSLEQGIGQPSATPSRLLGLVSPLLHSDKVAAARQRADALHSRLNEIASLHGGLVPLHGRLFSQWLHHAFPRECPYPHAAGTTEPVTQDQWLLMHPELEDVLATPQEQALLATWKTPVRPIVADDIPWSAVEELVAVHRQGPGHTGEYIRIVVCFTALLVFAWPLLRVGSRAIRASRRGPKATVIGAGMLAV